jgi:hypothetical protein
MELIVEVKSHTEATVLKKAFPDYQKVRVFSKIESSGL